MIWFVYVYLMYMCFSFCADLCVGIHLCAFNVILYFSLHVTSLYAYIYSFMYLTYVQAFLYMYPLRYLVMDVCLCIYVLIWVCLFIHSCTCSHSYIYLQYVYLLMYWSLFPYAFDLLSKYACLPKLCFLQATNPSFLCWVSAHVYIRICTHQCICTYLCMYLSMYIYIYIHAYLCVYFMYALTHRCMCSHVCIYIYVYVFICNNLHANFFFLFSLTKFILFVCSIRICTTYLSACVCVSFVLFIAFNFWSYPYWANPPGASFPQSIRWVWVSSLCSTHPGNVLSFFALMVMHQPFELNSLYFVKM